MAKKDKGVIGRGGVRGRGGVGKGREFPTALGRIDVGTCYTRGARSRRWCGWWGRRGRLRGGEGEGNELELRHGWLEI